MGEADGLSAEEVYKLAERARNWKNFLGNNTFYGCVGSLDVQLSYCLSRGIGGDNIPVEVDIRIENSGHSIGFASTRDQRAISLFQRVRKDYEQTQAQEKARAKTKGIDEARRLLSD